MQIKNPPQSSRLILSIHSILKFTIVTMARKFCLQFAQDPKLVSLDVMLPFIKKLMFFGKPRQIFSHEKILQTKPTTLISYERTGSVYLKNPLCWLITPGTNIRMYDVIENTHCYQGSLSGCIKTSWRG